jgi:hypothetical protein
LPARAPSRRKAEASLPARDRRCDLLRTQNRLSLAAVLPRLASVADGLLLLPPFPSERVMTSYLHDAAPPTEKGRVETSRFRGHRRQPRRQDARGVSGLKRIRGSPKRLRCWKARKGEKTASACRRPGVAALDLRHPCRCPGSGWCALPALRIEAAGAAPGENLGERSLQRQSSRANGAEKRGWEL